MGLDAFGNQDGRTFAHPQFKFDRRPPDAGREVLNATDLGKWKQHNRLPVGPLNHVVKMMFAFLDDFRWMFNAFNPCGRKAT